MSSAITVEDVGVQYQGVVALSNVTFSAPAGSSLAVIGSNGSGKSTLLGVLAKTVHPSAGSVHVLGPPPALVLQSTQVDQRLPITVREAVSLARYSTLGLFRRFAAADREAVDRSLDRMQIDDLADRQLRDLSGGQRQRALVAQGLAQETDVLLLDEPMTGVDVPSHAIILDVVDAEVAAGRTVVVTTHSLDDARRCERVLLLETSPVGFGAPSDVLTESNLERVFGTQNFGFGGHALPGENQHR